MKANLFYILAVGVLFVLATTSYAGSAPMWNTIVTGTQSEAESLATVDLVRYIGQASGQGPEIIEVSAWKAAPRPAIVVGTAVGNALVREAIQAAGDLGEEGFVLDQSGKGDRQMIIAAGATPAGAVNAIYGLLREAGFGFYMGSESIPDRLPDGLAASPVVRVPRFRMRGVLPWYNFFNSPTTWDPIDHRAFVDQLVRSGANFLGFHTYDGEPFGAYDDGGKMVMGARLLSTQSPTWGTFSTPTGEFAYGSDRLFAHPFFGAATTRMAGDTDMVIRREQAIMTEAFDYARRRGLHTCIGYELTGDPFKPEVREAFLKRFNHMLDQYPAADYVWLWQPETQGAQGVGGGYHAHMLSTQIDDDSPLRQYGKARRETFKRIVEDAKGEVPFWQDTEIGRQARANEGARLEQFAMLAYRQLAQRPAHPRLVMSGWGGEDRLMSAEYYDGLDKLLPKDVVFSSLDFIHPRPTVDSIYTQLPADRERWPIVWLENDGDMWQPQPYVSVLEKTVRHAADGGAQGMLGIHWRSREIEENLDYIVQYAWDPELTAEGYFARKALVDFGAELGPEMARIYTELDQLGYRWIGGRGQNECAPFTWGPGEEKKSASLLELRAAIADLVPRATRGKARLEWLLARIDWVVSYEKAERVALDAAALLEEAKAAGEEPVKREKATQALGLLDGDALATALHHYARRMTTRGEYGVMATVNAKAVYDWRRMRDEALEMLGRPAESLPSVPWKPEPSIVLPRHLGSIAQGQPLELSPIVLGGEKAWMHWRPLGAGPWRTVELSEKKGWVKSVGLEGALVVGPGLEFAFSFSADPAESMAWGPVAVTVMPEASGAK